MDQQSAFDVLLKIVCPDGTSQTVAGMRVTAMAADALVLNNPERVFEFSQMDRLTLSGGGVFKDAAADEAVRRMFFAGDTARWRIIRPGVGSLACECRIAGLEFGADHSGEIRFSMTLESVGPVEVEKEHQMKVYSIETNVVATVYVKADTREEAIQKARGLHGDCLKVTSDADSEVVVSALPFDHSALPEVSIGPVMTVYGCRPHTAMPARDNANRRDPMTNPDDAYLAKFPAEVRPYVERAYLDGFVDGVTSEQEAAG